MDLKNLRADITALSTTSTLWGDSDFIPTYRSFGAVPVTNIDNAILLTVAESIERENIIPGNWVGVWFDTLNV